MFGSESGLVIPGLESVLESEVVVFLEEFISVALWDGDWFRCWLDKGSLGINPDLLFAHCAVGTLQF